MDLLWLISGCVAGLFIIGCFVIGWLFGEGYEKEGEE